MNDPSGPEIRRQMIDSWSIQMIRFVIPSFNKDTLPPNRPLKDVITDIHETLLENPPQVSHSTEGLDAYTALIDKMQQQIDILEIASSPLSDEFLWYFLYSTATLVMMLQLPGPDRDHWDRLWQIRATQLVRSPLMFPSNVPSTNEFTNIRA